MPAQRDILAATLAVTLAILFPLTLLGCAESLPDGTQQRSFQIRSMGSGPIDAPCLSDGANLIALSDTAIQLSGCATVLGNVILMGDSTLGLDGQAKISSQVFARSKDSIQVSSRCQEGYGDFIAEDLTSREGELLSFAQHLNQVARTSTVDKLSGEVVGKGGLNVIASRHELRLSSKQTLTLRGSSADRFVVIIEEGGIVLTGDAAIKLAGISVTQVLFYVAGGNAILISGNASASGTFLAPQSSLMVAGNGKINGPVAAQGSIMMSGKGLSTGPASFCPQIQLPAPTPPDDGGGEGPPSDGPLPFKRSE